MKKTLNMNRINKKEVFMKKFVGIFVAMVFVMGMAGIATAADHDSHTVTITIADLNHILVTGGNVSLTINDVDGSMNPLDDTDNSTGLLWITNSGTAKRITAQLDADYASGIILKVAASDGSTVGTSAGTITLSSSSAQSVITGSQSEIGSSTLTYTASATASAAPNGAGETHTVTYTITD